MNASPYSRDRNVRSLLCVQLDVFLPLLTIWRGPERSIVNQASAVCFETDNAPRSLDELETRVQGKLCGRIRELQLVLDDHGIVLRGFARSYHAKQLAQHAVMSETAVPILANEI